MDSIQQSRRRIYAKNQIRGTSFNAAPRIASQDQFTKMGLACKPVKPVPFTLQKPTR